MSTSTLSGSASVYMERITYVLSNSVTENRAGFLSFVNQLLPCPERRHLRRKTSRHQPCQSPALLRWGCVSPKRRAGRFFFTRRASRQGGPRTCLKIAVDSRINGQGMARNHARLPRMRGEALRLEPSIVCPNCRTEIKLTETLAAPLIEAVRRESDQKLRSKEAEIVKREAAIRAQQAAMKEAKEAMEAELAERLKGERKKVAEEEARKARAAVSIDLNHKDQQLEELAKAFKEREAKLAEAQKAQADAVRKQRELAEKEREFDLTVEKRVLETQAEIQQRAKAEAEEALGLKVQEREQTILSMQKQIEELKRKAEQGSQQLQGEVQELQLEALLRASFPHDTITPVPKGEFGGDAIQLVTTRSGKPAAKSFGN